jgi:hypothetical protein
MRFHMHKTYITYSFSWRDSETVLGAFGRFGWDLQDFPLTLGMLLATRLAALFDTMWYRARPGAFGV